MSLTFFSPLVPSTATQFVVEGSSTVFRYRHPIWLTVPLMYREDYVPVHRRPARRRWLRRPLWRAQYPHRDAHSTDTSPDSPSLCAALL